MKVTIVGSGYVGLVTGACLAEYGNDVFFLDLDPDRIGILNQGKVPIHEPGLEELIERNRAAGRITFSTDVPASVAHGEFQFIAVGTPAREDGSADLAAVMEAAKNIGRYMTSFKVVVDKSTVPVGTAAQVADVIRSELRQRGQHDVTANGDGNTALFSVVSNPEFLKEGAAVEDFMRPDRIVVGYDNDAAGAKACALMKSLYAPLTRNHERFLFMDVRSAEFTKYASNAMLATRISFMNELANLAEEAGADIELVRQGMGSDPRIGFSFLYAGTGYGGSCFPKDLQALMQTGKKHDRPLRILEAVHHVNNQQKGVLMRKIVRRFGSDLTGRHFAIWGLAFKPNTDDMREAPSRVVIAELLRHGASIHAFDPIASEEAARVLRTELSEDDFARLHFHETHMEALERCDALVIMTDWKVFQSPDFERMKRLLKEPHIFDGRNMYEPHQMAERGLVYEGIGRSGGVQ